MSAVDFTNYAEPGKVKLTSLFSRVLQLRRGGVVERFHKEPWNGRRQTVAEHSYGVTMLLFEVSETPVSTRLVQAALHHDLHECIIGDLPATTLWDLKRDPSMERVITDLETRARRVLRLVGPETVYEKALLKVCDTLDGLFTVLEQVGWGNVQAGIVLGRWLAFLRKPPMVGSLELFPAAEVLVDQIERQYEELRKDPGYQVKERVLQSLPENGLW